MTKDHVRCFLALTVSKKAQDQLGTIQQELKDNGAKARWVRPRNIHITLRFLGNCDPGQVKKIAAALPQIVGDTPPFKIQISELRAFPSLERPNVIWAGMDDGAQETVEIFHCLDTGLAKIGIPENQDDFVPHFTLGRCKTPKESRAAAAAIKKAPMFSIEAFAESVTFFQSTLHAEGSIYEPIQRVMLQ